MILPSEEKKQNLRGKKAKPCGSSFDAEFEKKEKERKSLQMLKRQTGADWRSAPKKKKKKRKKKSNAGKVAPGSLTAGTCAS